MFFLIVDQKVLEQVREYFLVATRSVFVEEPDAAAGVPPLCELTIFLEDQSVSVWMFSVGFSTTQYAQADKLFYSKKIGA